MPIFLWKMFLLLLNKSHTNVITMYYFIIIIFFIHTTLLTLNGIKCSPWGSPSSQVPKWQETKHMDLLQNCWIQPNLLFCSWKSTMIEGVEGGGVFFFFFCFPCVPNVFPSMFPKFPKLFLNTFPSWLGI
jgi:hypothetical protein